MDTSASLPTFRFPSQSSSNLKSISASASYQSHISSRHTQQRLRTSRLAKLSDISFSAAPTSRTFAWTVSSWVGLSRRSHHRSWWTWLIWGYCFLSVILFTRKIYAEIVTRMIYHGGVTSCSVHVSVLGVHYVLFHVAAPSHLDFLSTNDKLFKLTSVRPVPDGFHPYYAGDYSSGSVDPNVITACAWLHIDELSNRTSVNHLKHWAKSWNAPISLVVVAHSPTSTFSKIIAHRLSSDSTLATFLKIHVMHVDSHTSYSPNALLNLARLFAPTPNVLLLPAPLSSLPIPASPGASHAIHSSSRLILANFTMSPTPSAHSYPFTALSPILLARSYPFWCTERFFPPLSRAADWDECIWELWLDSYGLLGTATAAHTGGKAYKPGAKSNSVVTEGGLAGAASLVWGERYGNGSDVDVAREHPVGVTNAIRKRLRARFKSETCILAIRKLEMLRMDDNEHATDSKQISDEGPGRKGRVEAEFVRRMKWLKETCREWMN